MSFIFTKYEFLLFLISKNSQTSNNISEKEKSKFYTYFCLNSKLIVIGFNGLLVNIS